MRYRLTVFLTLIVLVLPVALAAWAEESAAPASTVQSKCGKERWAVKTLTDADADAVNLTAKSTTVRALRNRPAPGSGLGSWPRISGVETTTYRVRAELVEMKIERDEDIHLVVAQPGAPDLTMIVEFPSLACTVGAAAGVRQKMLDARGALVSVCGPPLKSRFVELDGTATISGVGFFDVIHGQRGVAPNGIELHPVLRVSNATCQREPPGPSPPAPGPVSPPPPPPPPTTAPDNCDPSYPTVCIQPYSQVGDLDCGDIPYRSFKVLPSDPHGFDGRDNDGVGCES